MRTYAFSNEMMKNLLLASDSRSGISAGGGGVNGDLTN